MPQQQMSHISPPSSGPSSMNVANATNKELSPLESDGDDVELLRKYGLDQFSLLDSTDGNSSGSRMEGDISNMFKGMPRMSTKNTKICTGITREF